MNPEVKLKQEIDNIHRELIILDKQLENILNLICDFQDYDMDLEKVIGLNNIQECNTIYFNISRKLNKLKFKIYMYSNKDFLNSLSNK